jgi:hypothetical protein
VSLMVIFIVERIRKLFIGMCCNFQGGWLVDVNREMGTRPAIFKWRQTEPGIILCAVRWYLRYSVSLRDVEELLRRRHDSRFKAR